MWTIHQSRAQLHNDKLTATLSLKSPAHGLTDITALASEQTEHSMLCLNLHGSEENQTETVLESYVRGGDLVVTYGPQPDRPITSQLIWRSLTWNQLAAGIEVVISLETNQLYQLATIHTSTCVIADEILFRSAAGDWIVSKHPPQVTAVLVRLAGGMSYLEVAHPMDAAGFLLQREKNTRQWDFTLLDQTLEKGVIRRARIQGWWLASDSDQDAAELIIESFTNSPLPLTT